MKLLARFNFAVLVANQSFVALINVYSVLQVKSELVCAVSSIDFQ